jgi:hypothetical protein
MSLIIAHLDTHASHDGALEPYLEQASDANAARLGDATGHNSMVNGHRSPGVFKVIVAHMLSVLCRLQRATVT